MIVMETQTTSLCHCAKCDRYMVYPVEREETYFMGMTFWDVEVRCPNCEHRWDDLIPQELVDEWEKELDAWMKVLVKDLVSLQKENMEEWVERFVYALYCGAIVPEDFR